MADVAVAGSSSRGPRDASGRPPSHPARRRRRTKSSIGDHLGADEAFLEVGVDDAGGLGGGGTALHRPGSRLLGAGGEEGEQAQQRVALADDPVQAGLVRPRLARYSGPLAGAEAASSASMRGRRRRRGARRAARPWRRPGRSARCRSRPRPRRRCRRYSTGLAVSRWKPAQQGALLVAASSSARADAPPPSPAGCARADRAAPSPPCPGPWRA